MWVHVGNLKSGIFLDKSRFQNLIDVIIFSAHDLFYQHLGGNIWISSTISLTPDSRTQASSQRSQCWLVLCLKQGEGSLLASRGLGGEGKGGQTHPAEHRHRADGQWRHLSTPQLKSSILNTILYELLEANLREPRLLSLDLFCFPAGREGDGNARTQADSFR